MPLNNPLPTTTVTTGQTGHASLHTEERTMLEELRQKVNEVVEAASVTGNATLSWSAGAFKDYTLTGSTTFAFALTDPLSSGGLAGQPVQITVRLTQDATGGHVASFPATVKWAGGAAPSLASQAGAVNWLSFVTLDAGTTWTGFVIARDVR